MRPGDWALCVFENRYRYVARVIAKYENYAAAQGIWGSLDSGETWQLMYFLSRPTAIDIPVEKLADYLNRGYMGFTRIAEERLERAIRDFGTVDSFIQEALLSSGETSQTFVEIPDGITRDDVLGAIRELDAGIEHPFGPSVIYDLIHDHRRYPPKAAIGLAARRVLGRILKPHEFSGGEQSKAFRVLRDLGFEIKPKVDEVPYLLIRSNEQSEYADNLGDCYRFTSNVPNHKKLLSGALVAVDRKTTGGVVLVGYGRLGAADTAEERSDDRPASFVSHFEDWTPIDPPVPVPKEASDYIRGLPGFNVQHAVRVIDKKAYDLMTAIGAENEISLIGTWRSVENDRTHVESMIREKGAWASWWSFVIPEGLIKDLQVPFWLYANAGGGQFPIRLQVSEYKHRYGSQGIETPWPEITDTQWRGKTRAGERQNEVFKTWLKITRVEVLEPPLSTEAFLPVEPWSTNSSVLNQNAFGFVRRRQTRGASAMPSYSMDDAWRDLFMPRVDLEAIVAGLRRKKNVILQGPPGVGKTFAARRLAYALMGSKDDTRIALVQFHQSYSYEDFVQGWRPTSTGGFSLRNGPFYEFCRSAADRPGLPYIFIVDEINRGNLSKILGELMMLIEPDKRGPEYAMRLTYSGTDDAEFFVPENVHIIGLMNTADRSLALVDYALRRRFAFHGLEPHVDSDRFAAHLESQGVGRELISEIRSRIRVLNEEICRNPHLGRGFQIGHSYFCAYDHSVSDAGWYASIIEYEIAPLIREFWFDQRDIAEGFIKDLRL
jgi:hypothetical protein